MRDVFSQQSIEAPQVQMEQLELVGGLFVPKNTLQLSLSSVGRNREQLTEQLNSAEIVIKSPTACFRCRSWDTENPGGNSFRDRALLTLKRCGIDVEITKASQLFLTERSADLGYFRTPGLIPNKSASFLLQYDVGGQERPETFVAQVIAAFRIGGPEIAYQRLLSGLVSVTEIQWTE